MTSFADVAAFARQHTACGGLVPRAHSKRDGGYMLTMTCTCGAVYERWVEPAEAQHLPHLDAPPAVPPRPPPVPSPELMAALQEALAEPKPSAPPAAPTLAADAGAGTPNAAPPSGPPRAPSSARGTPTPPEMTAVILEALQAQQAAADAPDADKPRRHAMLVAVGAVACLVLTGAGMLWVAQLESRRPAPSPAATAGSSERAGAPAPSATSTAPAPGAFTLSEDDRRALDTALDSLRQLQSVSNTGNTFPFYRSRVEMMQARVQPFLTGRAPGELRQALRDVVDVHQLAAEIWNARLEDQPDAWARVDRRDVLQTCASVARILEFNERASGTGQPRSQVLGSAIPLLWTCSSERLARVERMLEGR